jgi:glycosyltransferase involved in cell wall biosynthesis
MTTPTFPGNVVEGDLRIAYLMPSVSRAAGGIFEIERRLAQSLVELPDVHLEAFAAEDEFTSLDIGSWQPLTLHTFRRYGPKSFGWSPALSRAFAAAEADVAHLHALWMHTSLIMKDWSGRHHRPYVTTLHGMLEPWALGNSRWKKRLCGLVYERSCLAKAACIQISTEGELASARKFGLKNPICIIPNGIDAPQETKVQPPWAAAAPNGKKILLYLGRLHPKKGLVNMLGAWKQLLNQSHPSLNEWRLVIGGWSQSGHEAELKSLAAAYGIERDVIFVGPLYNDAKAAAYQHADAVVLPSYSEGLPMAVLEAWSYGKPVLMTPQCNLSEGFAAGAAIQSQPEINSLAKGLAQLVEASDEERACMGQRGRELVNRKFTWTSVATEMHSVYRWLAGGGPAPACVVRQ